MSERPTNAQLALLAHRVRPGSTVIRSWPLEGGVSAQVTAVEISNPNGRIERIVVRRHGEIDKGHNPHIAEDEFQLLSTLHDAGVAVPAPLHLDRAGEIFGTPSLAMAFVDGSTEIAAEQVPDAIRQMANYLARLHALQLDRIDVSFLPRRQGPVALALQHLQDMEGSYPIRHDLATTQAASTNAPALLHGDFWPGNILWGDGRIAAVLDWEDAAIGDPLADLASSRLELLWKYGHESMEAFTSHYLALTPLDLADLPLWELASASGAVASMASWGLDPDTEADMRKKGHWFMEQARQSLAAPRRR